MVNLKGIGERIKDARVAKRLTQEQLAEMIDISPTHMSVIERGVKLPRLKTFIEIVNALDMTADELLCDVLNHSSLVLNDLPEEFSRLSSEDKEKLLKIIRVLFDEDEKPPFPVLWKHT